MLSLSAGDTLAKKGPVTPPRQLRQSRCDAGEGCINSLNMPYVMDRSPRAARHVYRRRRVKAPGRGQDRWFFHPLYRNYVHEATADIYSRASLVAESATSKQWDLVKYVATARSAMRSCPRRRRTLMRRHCSRSPASASPTRWSCRL